MLDLVILFKVLSSKSIIFKIMKHLEEKTYT